MREKDEERIKDLLQMHETDIREMRKNLKEMEVRTCRAKRHNSEFLEYLFIVSISLLIAIGVGVLAGKTQFESVLLAMVVFFGMICVSYIIPIYYRVKDIGEVK